MNKNNDNQKITSSEGYYGVDTYNKNGYIGTAIESNEKNIYKKVPGLFLLPCRRDEPCWLR